MEHKDTDDWMAEDEAARPDAPPPPSSSGGFPVIKIKIPKMAEGEAAAAEEVKSHCCKECKKSFSSGKALGGHMSSAHVQANKDYSAVKKLSSSSKKRGASASDNYGCMLCEKSFHTKKSLFGHMRCHPEREWRGMEPPPEIKIPSLSPEASSEEDGGGGGGGDGPDAEDQIVSGLGFDLKGWPISNKRGRGPVGIINPVIRAPDSEERERESFVAGLQLIKMLKGDSAKEEGDSPARPRPELNFKNSTSTSQGKGKEKLQENQDSGTDPNDELYETAIQVLVSVKRDKLDTQKRAEAETMSITPHKGGDNQPDTAASSPEKYKCNVCGRQFPTHQALGGHRSSHNKLKITVINTNSRDPTITKKKRNYSKKEKSVNADAERDASSSSFAFAFDLNMVPQAEEEEMEMDDSSNHTSSSC